MKLKVLLYAAAICLIAACNGKQEPVRLYGEAQGSYYTVIYYDAEQRNLQPEIDSLLRWFDSEVSLWVDSSLIRQVNDCQTTELTPTFATILRHALDIQDYTDGAFDCRIGRLVQAWGFSFKEQESLSDEQIATLLADARAPIAIDTASDGSLHIVKASKDTEIDFNAIAQGYASDLVGKLLQSKGIDNFLVDIGGEVLTKGCKDGGKPWLVGIERPAEEKDDAPKVELTISLRDLAVVTSGSYRKYYEKDGVRYSHTIDPATGKPVTHTLLSVSVIDSTAWRADALATAFMVMGLEKSRQFIAEHPDDMAVQTVLFIYNNGGRNEIYATPRFEEMIDKR